MDSFQENKTKQNPKNKKTLLERHIKEEKSTKKMKKELSKSKERSRRTVLWTKGHNGEAGVKGGLHCPVLLVREGPVVWG